MSRNPTLGQMAHSRHIVVVLRDLKSWLCHFLAQKGATVGAGGGMLNLLAIQTLEGKDCFFSY